MYGRLGRLPLREAPLTVCYEISYEAERIEVVTVVLPWEYTMKDVAIFFQTFDYPGFPLA